MHLIIDVVSILSTQFSNVQILVRHDLITNSGISYRFVFLSSFSQILFDFRAMLLVRDPSKYSFYGSAGTRPLWKSRKVAEGVDEDVLSFWGGNSC